MRARLVRGVSLSDVASSIGLGQHLKLGEGEMKTGGFRRTSILADAYEALIGAIFLDGGYASCQTEILRLFDPLIENLPDVEELKDAKTRLQEWLQARKLSLPIYDLVSVTGKDHRQKFVVSCTVNELSQTTEGDSTSRRKAEQRAASAMLGMLSGEGP